MTPLRATWYKLMIGISIFDLLLWGHVVVIRATPPHINWEAVAWLIANMGICLYACYQLGKDK